MIPALAPLEQRKSPGNYVADDLARRWRYPSRDGRKQWDIAWESMFYVARQGSAANHAKAVAIVPPTAAEVRMFGMGPWLRERFNRLSREMLAEMTPRRLRGGAWAIGGFLIQALVIAACFVYVARRADDVTIPIADLAFFISGLLAAQHHGRGL